MELGDLLKLNFHKKEGIEKEGEEENEYICPITFKPFSSHSHIVAIKTSGEVYSFEAIKNFNYASNNMNCLMSGIPFTKKDVLTLQNPNQYTLSSNLKTQQENEQKKRKESEKESTTENNNSIQISNNNSISKKVKKEEIKSKINYSAPSFTSSSFQAKSNSHKKPVEAKQIDKKTLCRMYTNMGVLNLLIHSDLVPVTAENFLTHAENGYYNSIKFHRLIKGFCIQGGGKNYFSNNFFFHPKINNS